MMRSSHDKSNVSYSVTEFLWQNFYLIVCTKEELYQWTKYWLASGYFSLLIRLVHMFAAYTKAYTKATLIQIIIIMDCVISI